MSTIEEVRAAERRLQRILDVLRDARAEDANHVANELKKASEEYTKAVRELTSK